MPIARLSFAPRRREGDSNLLFRSHGMLGCGQITIGTEETLAIQPQAPRTSQDFH
jgi:hypothetical protein